MSWIENIKIQVMLNKFVMLVILGFGLTHFAMPLWVDFLISSSLLFLFKKPVESIFFALFCFVIAISGSWMWGSKDIDKVYYRPHERFQMEGNKYYPNINVKMNMPYGDLYSLGKQSHKGNIEKIKEPRTVHFKTDNLGFRNDVELKEAEIILAGDSFIVGHGSSQEVTPSVALKDRLNINVGNIAYPGNPEDYENQLLQHRERYSDDASILVFYFEGNDFFRGKTSLKEDVGNKKTLSIMEIYNELEHIKDRYLKMIYPNEQVLFRLVRRISYALTDKVKNTLKGIMNRSVNKSNANLRVTTLSINGSEVGFFNYYNDISNSKELETYIFKDESLLKRIKGVFFIPTKYRIYSSWIKGSTSNSALNYLRSGYETSNIPVFDLTPALVKEAETALDRNEFVFWRDDTHWNGLGIDVSMNEVAKQLKAMRIVDAPE